MFFLSKNARKKRTSLKDEQDGASTPKQGKMSVERRREVDVEDLNRSAHNNGNDSSN